MRNANPPNLPFTGELNSKLNSPLEGGLGGSVFIFYFESTLLGGAKEISITSSHSDATILLYVLLSQNGNNLFFLFSLLVKY
jgi:hypothetical protein